MKQRTLIWVHTDEPVTPEYIAQRVAEACAAYGALRPGESISLANESAKRFTVTELRQPQPTRSV